MVLEKETHQTLVGLFFLEEDEREEKLFLLN